MLTRAAKNNTISEELIGRGSIFMRCLIKHKKIFAFTISEIIVTLGILFLVASLTVPKMIENAKNYVFSKSQFITLMKIKDATSRMKTSDELTGYLTTDAFADMFQKYLQTQKRCNATNLSECFVSTFKTSNNSPVSLSSFSNGADLGQGSYSSPLVGFVLLDNVTMIIAYNPSCPKIETWDAKTSSTACLSAMYDVNGFEAPNQVGKDIYTINASLPIMVGNLKVATSNLDYKASMEYPFPSGEAPTSFNFWAGARDTCLAQGMRLPTIEELTAMCVFDIKNNHILNMSNGDPYYWSSTEDDQNRAEAMKFLTGAIISSQKSATTIYARCVK